MNKVLRILSSLAVGIGLILLFVYCGFRRNAEAWWNHRIAVAYDVRRTLDLTDNEQTNCYRLVHGEILTKCVI